MRRVVHLITAAALMLLMGSIAEAYAHEPAVLPAGSQRIDLADGSQDRLLHATLVAPADALTITLRHAADAPELLVRVLVPDAGAEHDATGAALPAATVEDAGQRRSLAPLDTPERIEDAVAGFTYRVIAEFPIDGELGTSRSPATIVVTRGSLPTRVALAVTRADATFATTDPRRTSATLLRTRAWFERGAPGAPLGSQHAQSPTRGGRIWIPIGVAVVAVLLAGWWIASGRRTARRQGIERSRRQ